MSTDRPSLPVMAIAGATGFVGQALRRALTQRFEVVGLTRSPTRAQIESETGTRWRHCDLFSIKEVEEALRGVDYAVYLVHSMLPSARLTQASFVDLDLLLADNFARAAERNGVKQILYVGGIRPDETDEQLSRHLISRLEVERTLAGRAVPVTAIRAGIILGPGGSSMRMMVNLVRRLPFMILPAWCDSVSAPIAIDDVVRAAEEVIGNERAFGESFDIGGPEQMTYRAMMERTAQVLDVEVRMLSVPVFSTTLSRTWVSLVSGAPDALVGPLIESLRHSMVPGDNWLQVALRDKAIPFETALRNSLDEDRNLLDNPRRILRSSDDRRLKQARTVRSVQRLPLPRGTGAEWVAAEYARWLPKFVWPFLEAEVNEGGVIFFRLRGLRWTLLQLTPAPEFSTPDRQLYLITGGLLARTSDEAYQGRFEFREVLDGQALIAAIHDFQPTLPWYVYNLSQALVHLLVMQGYGRHLGLVDRRLAEGATPAQLSAGSDK
ncbi:MAG: NAD(P)H-binding protein [Myxococcota bacterium]